MVVRIPARFTLFKFAGLTELAHLYYAHAWNGIQTLWTTNLKTSVPVRTCTFSRGFGQRPLRMRETTPHAHTVLYYAYAYTPMKCTCVGGVQSQQSHYFCACRTLLKWRSGKMDGETVGKVRTSRPSETVVSSQPFLAGCGLRVAVSRPAG